MSGDKDKQSELDTLSVIQGNFECERDELKVARDLLESSMIERVGGIQSGVNMETAAFFAAQVLANGELRELNGKLILGEITPSDLWLLQTASRGINHDSLYKDGYETSHEMIDVWEDANRNLGDLAKKLFGE